MATYNDITGDSLSSKGSTKEYRDNYNRIFGKKTKEKESTVTTQAAGGERKEKS